MATDMLSGMLKERTLADPQEVLSFIRANGIKFVDIKFVDLIGSWQHFTIPVNQLDEDVFVDGLGFDGSSIRGFQKIHESDMLLIPDPTTVFIDPVHKYPTISMTCDIKDPTTGGPYSRDPRYITRKAEAYLRSTGIATTSYWGPEAEFFIFNDVRFDQGPNFGFYHLDSEEGIWNSGKNGGTPNLGYRPRSKEGYYPAAPMDRLTDLRSEMVLRLMECGLNIETQHHEVATAGQAEIDIKYDTMLKQADNLMIFKYIIKNVAIANGHTVTFMPKPIFGDNGSGMHVHQSLWKDGDNIFFDKAGYAGLSDAARWYIGGLLKHAPALLGLCAPTTNSYRRLVPGFEAPVNLIYSQRNRSACIRIPMYSASEKAKRIEFRCPDPTANPYLAFPAMMLAGLDGITNRIEPDAPVDKDLYELEPEDAMKIKSTPGSLAEVLDALEADHDFLLKGDVFTKDVIETWIDYKRERELAPVALRPHPYEFHLYYDI